MRAKKPPMIEWKRPEYQGRLDELETPVQTAERLSISLSMLRSYVARYPEMYPEVVARKARLTYRDPAEVDKFMAWLKKRDKNRTGAERAAGEVLRLTKSLETARNSERRLEQLYAEAKRNTARISTALRVQQEMAELLSVADRKK